MDQSWTIPWQSHLIWENMWSRLKMNVLRILLVANISTMICSWRVTMDQCSCFQTGDRSVISIGVIYLHACFSSSFVSSLPPPQCNRCYLPLTYTLLHVDQHDNYTRYSLSKRIYELDYNMLYYLGSWQYNISHHNIYSRITLILV